MELGELLKYDGWANTRALRAMAEAGERCPQTAVDLMAHILDAQEVWLIRIDGGEAAPTKRSLPLADLAPWAEANAARLAGVLAGGEAGLARVLTYRNSTGAAFTNTVGEIMTHLMLHGTHHRAQISTLLRQAGAVPLPLDYIIMLREG